MNRQAVLSSLIRFDAPLADLESSLAKLAWDSDRAATLTRRDILAVLQRFADGGINAAAVETWANLLECREDVEFEPGHEAAVADALHALANPELEGPLQAIMPEMLVGLGHR